jgi:hypothetical protein
MYITLVNIIMGLVGDCFNMSVSIEAVQQVPSQFCSVMLQLRTEPGHC